VVTLADVLKIGIGIAIGFIASVSRDSLNIKNKAKQEFKLKKQQKLEELLNLLETTNKDSLVSISLKLAEGSNEEIEVLKKILENKFDDPEIIKYNEANYAKIKTITSLYLNKYKQHVDHHITMIKSLDLYQQISLQNAISTARLIDEFKNEKSLIGKDAEKVKQLTQKFEKDKRKEEGLEKKINISFNEFKDVIVRELV